MANHYLVFGLFIDDNTGKYCTANTTFSCDGFPDQASLEPALTTYVKMKTNKIPRGIVQVTGITPLTSLDQGRVWRGESH